MNTTEIEARQHDITQINSLIGKFDTAMLISESVDGELRGRPMSLAGTRTGSLAEALEGEQVISSLYFFTRADDEKLKEIDRRPDVNVAMQSEGLYLSITGRARIEASHGLVDEFWTTAAQLWFPQGPEDPNLTLLAVEPSYAECWDRTGIRKLEFWWEAGKALLQQRKAEDDDLGGHSKIKVN